MTFPLLSGGYKVRAKRVTADVVASESVDGEAVPRLGSGLSEA